MSEQSKRDSRSVGGHDVGRRGRHEWGSSWRERKSESERAKERGWCPRQTGSHEEILHTQRLSISIFEREREDARAKKDPPRGRGRERDRGIERDGKCDTAGAVEWRQALVEVAATK